MQHQALDRIDPPEGEGGKLEFLPGPLLGAAKQPGGGTVRVGRVRRRLPHSQELEARQRQPIDHDLFFGQRHGIEIDRDGAGFEQVAAGIARVGDGQSGEIDRGISLANPETGEIDLSAEGLLKRGRGLVARDLVGQQEPEPDQQHRHEQQRPYGAPAKQLESPAHPGWNQL